jgi:RimJ/RimL family protein N-acetyltransferase
VLLEPQEKIGAWVCEHSHSLWNDKMTAIGVITDRDELVAGAVFDDFTGPRVAPHVVCLDPTAAPLLARLLCRYAFHQLGARALTLRAETGNIPAVSLHSRLGAVPEGRLIGAGRSGDDILLSRLDRSSPFVARVLREQRNGSGRT